MTPPRPATAPGPSAEGLPALRPRLDRQVPGTPFPVPTVQVLPLGQGAALARAETAEGYAVIPRGPNHQRVMDILAKEDVNFTEIGKRLGLSRERVRQIARANGYWATPKPQGKPRVLCPICKEKMLRTALPGTLGHAACRRVAYAVTRPCANCGKPVTRPLSVFRGIVAAHIRLGLQTPLLFFCDRRCKGLHLSRRVNGGTMRLCWCKGCGAPFTGVASSLWCAACTPWRCRVCHRLLGDPRKTKGPNAHRRCETPGEPPPRKTEH